MSEFDGIWSFIGREQKPFDESIIQPVVTGKRGLITGAAGFIGSALVRALARQSLEHIVLLDIAESGLHDLSLELDQNSAIVHEEIVGDVCDASLLDNVFHRYRPHIVFHAAACKHVPLMERNPFAAAKTNITGMQEIANAAAAFGVEDAILVSTDKVVSPASIMGATKRIAELIVLANRSKTRMKAVRLGNVWGSTGSVVPVLQRQIAQGGSITITDPSCTRHFLPIEEVVQRLLCSLLFAGYSTVYIADPGPPHHIVEVADFLLDQAGVNPTEIERRFIGLRPGEKLSEQMTSADESVTSSVVHGMQELHSPAPSPQLLHAAMEEIGAAVLHRDLSRLLQAILSIVPSYVPSGLLRSQMSEPVIASTIA